MNRLVKLFKPYLVFLTIIVLFAIPVFGGCSSSPRSTSILTTTTAKPESDVVVAWEKTFGGAGEEIAACVSPTLDGGYVITGATSPTLKEADRDIWIVKTDADGNKTWDKTYGGTAEDLGMSALQTRDGGYIIGAMSNSFGSGDLSIWVIWLIKIDASGDKVWDKTISGARSALIDSMMLTSDDGYLISGVTSSDLYKTSDGFVVKTDGQGNEVWSLTLGGPLYDHIWASNPTPDGGYIGAGGTDSSDNGSVWLIKIDGNGTKTWDKTFLRESSYDFGFLASQTNDRGYIVAGTGSTAASKADFWLIKTGAEGNKLWDRAFGGTNDEMLASAKHTLDDGCIMAGNTMSFGAGGRDAWLVKADSSGNKLWEKIFGGAGDDYATSACQTSDGAYIITGYTNSFGNGGNDFWMVKLSPLYDFQ
jgi:hypothetical protein